MKIVAHTLAGDTPEITIIADGATSAATGDVSSNGRSPFTVLVVPSMIEPVV